MSNAGLGWNIWPDFCHTLIMPSISWLLDERLLLLFTEYGVFLQKWDWHVRRLWSRVMHRYHAKLEHDRLPLKRDRYRKGLLWAAFSAFHVRAWSITISYLGRGGNGKLIRWPRTSSCDQQHPAVAWRTKVSRLAIRMGRLAKTKV